MIGNGSTYFHEQQCLANPHIIITGNTNDVFCGEGLIPVSLREELCMHLRRQGFDAVIFFDSSNVVYCYDTGSMAVLREGRAAPAQSRPARRAASPIMEQSLFGRRTRRRSQSAGAEAPTGPAPDSLNMGRLYTAQAWDRIRRLMANEELRIAFVFANADSMVRTFPDDMLQHLEELSAARMENQSIAIYIFAQNTLENLEATSRNGSPAWRTFAEAVLLPRVAGTDPELNSVLQLGAPNAAEIRNLLNWMRLREEDPLPVFNLGELAEEMAVWCANRRWTLNRLRMALEDFRRAHPGQRACMENWQQIIGAPREPSALETLDNMIGIEPVKRRIHARFDLANMNGERQTFSGSASRLAPPERAANRVLGHELNVALMGGPGTGKTTIARLLGRLYRDSGSLTRGHLIETTAGDIVGTHVGEAANNIRRLVTQALGGVLYIDEAYALVENDDPFGQQAVDQLVAEMSRHEGEFAVVLAGYPQPMRALLDSNDGLDRRFPERWELPDYDSGEMRQLLLRFAEAAGVELSPSLTEPTRRDDGSMRSMLDDFCEAWPDSKVGRWQNAGEVQTLIADMRKNHAMRMRGEDAPDSRLSELDIPRNLQYCLAPRSRKLAEALAAIDGIIGLRNVKAFLNKLANDTTWNISEQSEVPNYVFAGPPGTGKTHVARLLSDILYLLGVIRRRRVVERKAADFLQSDNPERLLTETVEEAAGGVCFIDECHQLMDSAAGRGVLRALVPLAEDHRRDTCFILAGYHDEMKRMFDGADAGLLRRFPAKGHIRFVDYTARELTQILEQFARQQGQICTQGYLDRTEAALERYLTNRPQNFGNAGFVRDVILPESISERSRRLNAEYANAERIADANAVRRVPDEIKRTLTEADVAPQLQNLAAPGAKPSEASSAFARIQRELVGKQAIIDFVRAFDRDPGDVRFMDQQSAGSICYAVSGPFGTGRRTAVRAAAAALCELGLLDSSHVRFASKGDFEAQYVGQTAPRTQAVIDSCFGGTLCVMNPSSMLSHNQNHNSFGPEALSVLAGNLNQPNLSIVFVDTKDGMEAFLRQYPSVRSALGGEFALDDLSPAEMERVFRINASESFTFDAALDAALPEFFLNWVSQRGGLSDRAGEWGNGGEAASLLDALRMNWESTSGETDRTGAAPRRIITRAMLPERLRAYLPEEAKKNATALDELNALTGLETVKQKVRALERRIRLKKTGVLPGCYCFLGSPGVGKTMCAQKLGAVLREAGVLTQGHVVERHAQQLIHRPASLEEAVKLAKNGVLFIDEAHELGMYSTGMETAHRLLTILEDPETLKHLCVILAGYPREMQQLFRQEKGLASRFGGSGMVYFEDYTAPELMSILRDMAARAHRIPQIGAAQPMELEDSFLSASRRIFERVTASTANSFGNARGVRNLLHDALDRMAQRADGGGSISQQPLTDADIPEVYQKLLSQDQEALSASISAELLRTRSDGPLTPQAIEAIERATVYLEVLDESGQPVGSGSGTIITESGVVLTCKHVADHPGSIVAVLRVPGIPGGKALRFPCAKLEPMHADCDMALLKMEGDGFPCVSIRPQGEAIDPSEKTLMCGFSLGDVINGRDADSLAPTRYNGSVASIQTMPNGIQRVYIDSRGTHGNSGSGMYSHADGRLIGVFSGSIKPQDEEINFFLPIEYLWDRFIVPTKEA